MERGDHRAPCALCFPRWHDAKGVAAGCGGGPCPIGPDFQWPVAGEQKPVGLRWRRKCSVAEDRARGCKAVAGRGRGTRRCPGFAWRVLRRLHGGARMGRSLPTTTSVNCSQCGQRRCQRGGGAAFSRTTVTFSGRLCEGCSSRLRLCLGPTLRSAISALLRSVAEHPAMFGGRMQPAEVAHALPAGHAIVPGFAFRVWCFGAPVGRRLTSL